MELSKNTIAVRKWLRRNAQIDRGAYREYGAIYGSYMGRKIRISGSGTLDFGAKDFDRWANSKVHSIMVDGSGDIARQINLGLSEADRNDTVSYPTRMWSLVEKLYQQYGNR